MNVSRIAALERSLNGTAFKVYQAVPIEEAWTVHQVAGELARRGCVQTQPVVLGCLGHLRGIGLVKEPEPGHFRRTSSARRLTVQVAPTQPSTPNHKESSMAEVKAAADKPHSKPSPKPSPVDRLGAESAALRIRAKELLAMADTLDAIALDAEALFQNLKEDAADYAALQAILARTANRASN